MKLQRPRRQQRHRLQRALQQDQVVGRIDAKAQQRVANALDDLRQSSRRHFTVVLDRQRQVGLFQARRQPAQRLFGPGRIGLVEHQAQRPAAKEQRQRDIIVQLVAIQSLGTDLDAQTQLVPEVP